MSVTAMYLRQLTWKVSLNLLDTVSAGFLGATKDFAQRRQEKKGRRRKEGIFISFAPFARWSLAPLREIKGRCQSSS